MKDTIMSAKFFTTRPNSQVIMPDGKRLKFVGNYMLLEEEAEIAYLRSLIKVSEGCIAERNVEDADFEDPIAKIKEQAIAEYIASIHKVTDAPAPTLKVSDVNVKATSK